MKTISLVSQLFQGYYSPDTSYVLRRIDNTTDRIGTELISGIITEITPTATSSNGKTVKIQVLLALENVWQTGIELSSGETWTVPSSVTFDTVILRLAYSDNSRITVGQITQLNVSYDGTLKLPWKMGDDNYPTRDDFLDLPATAMSQPYPDALWRIDDGYNEHLPYNNLLPDIVHIVPVEPVRQKDYICVYDMETPQNGFDNNGLAIIFPTVCRVSEKLNDEWSVYLEHPIDDDGKWKYLLEYNILKIMGQLFVIYKVDVQFNGGKGTVKIYADHIFYQLSCGFVYPADNGIPDVPKVRSVIYRIMTRSDFHHESGQTYYAYTYNSDIERTEQTFNYEYDLTSGATPTELIMGGNGVISQRGGELYRNNFYFSLNNRMENAYENGFELRVGRDLRGIKRSVDLSTVCTYFKGIDNYGNWFAISYTPGGVERQMPRHVVRGAKFNYDKYEGSMERLTADCYAFFGENCRPKITYTIDLIDVRNNPDFAVFTNNPRYKVGDKGIVYDERLDINLTLEITKTVIDAITGEVTQVTFGEERSFTRPHSYSDSLVTPEREVVLAEVKRTKIRSFTSWQSLDNYTWGQLAEFSWNQLAGNTEWGDEEEEEE